MIAATPGWHTAIGAVGALQRWRTSRTSFYEIPCSPRLTCHPACCGGLTESISERKRRILRTFPPGGTGKPSPALRKKPSTIQAEPSGRGRWLVIRSCGILHGHGYHQSAKPPPKWVAHYNKARPHSSLGPGIPDPCVALQAPGPSRHQIACAHRVIATHVLGGLHHEYRLAKVAA
jgi:hypothetical protein